MIATIFFLWFFFRASARWGRQEPPKLRVLLVDYTVPFDNYREHGGVLWVLNHGKLPTPSGKAWKASSDYVGYDPKDRANPKRVSAADLSGYDVVYISDTYGVYRDDIIGAPFHRAHMDYNPLHFGGLSPADAALLANFAADGGAVISEFNTFCAPTGGSARKTMEELHELEWTGWVGRVFVDPADENDVPAWFPREFAKQFPNRPYPTQAMLVFADESGTLAVFESPDAESLAPQVMLSEKGKERFRSAHSKARYYFWFSLMKPKPEAKVVASLAFDPRDDLRTWLQKNVGSETPPAFVANSRDSAFYFVGDFGDVDFPPGEFGRADILEDMAEKSLEIRGATQAQLFWRFYAPALLDLFSQLDRR